MPPITILDIDKMCCVCLRIELDMNLIFKSENNPTVAEMLSETTIYKIQPCDELPHLICTDCLNVVISAFRLKRQCEESYRTLMGLLMCEKDESLLNRQSNDLLEKSTQTEESSMFPCERCEEKFFSFEKLRSHRHIAHKGVGNICRFCSRSFPRITDLKIHLGIAHPETGYKARYHCHICQKAFIRKLDMGQHLKKVHKMVDYSLETSREDKEDAKKVKPSSNKDIKPPIALEETETDKNLYHLRQEDNLEDLTEAEVKTHLQIKIDEDEKPLADLLNDSASSSKYLGIKIDEDEKHLADLLNDSASSSKYLGIKIDEDEKPLADLLNDSASSSQTIEGSNNIFIQHSEIKIAEGEKPLADSLNSSASSSQTIEDVVNESIMEDDNKSENITPHKTKIAKQKTKNNQNKLKLPKRGRPFRIRPNCKYCEESYDDLLMLQQHIAENHIELHDFPCKICGNTLKTEDDHKKHFNTYHSDKHAKKPYVCRSCSQDFDTPEELSNHAKVHSNRSMLCTLCGLRCRSKNILAVHMRRHNGEKPFQCKYCSKAFPRIDDVKIHEKFHTGVKAHFCEFCGKGFLRSDTHKIHLRIHTGEKPFKCTFCPQAFTQSNDLKTHIRRHTGERFRCEICGAEFLQAYKIRQHKLKEHDIHEIPPTQRLKKFTTPKEQDKKLEQ